MRAKPIVALGVVAGALVFTGAAHALGLGKLTVQSSLGQPLSAQIELSSVGRDELDSLAVKIADPALYRQNNLAYHGVLSRARVTVERGSGGEPYLKVVTQGPVNEPYLDLMVEVNWASGRLVRDYTFLLDPPGVIPTPVEPIAPVRVGVAPPRPRPAQASAQPSAQAPAESGARSGGDTYAVKRGDTLSKIATEYKPSSVTLEQMLVALFNANQGAFESNNINRLRAGSIVTIPSADAATATPPPEAAKIVRMQASDWRTYRDRVAATAPASAAAGGRAAGGRIGTTVEEVVPAVPPGRDQLKVSREVVPAKGAGGATEESVARDRQIKEAQTRIAELEKTLSELQRAVELKNQAMAQLQTQAEAGKGQPSKAVAPPSAPELKIAEAAKTEPPKAAEAPKAAEPGSVAGAKPAEAPKPAPKAPSQASPGPKSEVSFFDDLLATTPPWVIGGGALAVLGGILAIIAARRRKTTKFGDGIIADTDIKTNTVFGSTGGGVVNTGDNSLSGEFSREGLGSIDTDEVDPIAEAEVYLAYGRDAQAEEILKHALRKDPQRQEVYLKLLEIHAQHNKPSSFETVAAELYSVSQGQGEIWQKAVALGRQLDPNNPMFADAKTGSATGPATGAGLAGDTQTFSVTPDLKPEAPRGGDSPAAVRAGNGGDDNMFDFRLDEELSMKPVAGVKPKSPVDILAGAESELEKTARSAAIAAAGGTTVTALAGAIDKAKSDADRATEALERKIDAAGLGAGLDFHLDESEKPATLKPAVPAGERLAGSQAAIGLDKLDLSFDRGQPAVKDGTPSVMDGQWHDAATKLDLAKAYQEMGDVEGSREILREVLREGDDQQKVEAQALIDKLG